MYNKVPGPGSAQAGPDGRRKKGVSPRARRLAAKRGIDPLALTGSGSYNEATGHYEFTGTSSVQTLNNLNPESPYFPPHDITTNTVDLIQYRLDGGAWIDGATYGGYSVAVAQDVPAGPGTHTVEFRTVVAETGVTSPVWSAPR